MVLVALSTKCFVVECLHFAESSTILQMSRNQWTLFTQECNIVDPKSPGVKPSDLDTMFVSTNFEEDAGTQEAEANDDDALVR